MAKLPFLSRFKTIGLLVFLCCTAVATLHAQGKAFASIKPERVETGDTFSLFVIVSDIKTQPKSVDFVSWSDVFPATNILSRADWRRSGAQWVQQFTLISFDSASLDLPPLTVLMPVGKPLITNALTLTVFPTRGAELSEMAPIRDIYREPISWMDYWPWGAATLAVIGLFVWMQRRAARRKKPVVAAVLIPQAPPISASEIALKQLAELQQRQLWKKDQVKEHYAALSLIVREYLETNYNIAALESTTAEILPLLSSTTFSSNLIPLLRDILHKTDMVKYAQSKPPEATHNAILEKARELITPIHLKKTPPPTPPPNAPPIQKPKSGKYEPL
jgi:hypothetical protein